MLQQIGLDRIGSPVSELLEAHSPHVRRCLQDGLHLIVTNVFGQANEVARLFNIRSAISGAQPGAALGRSHADVGNINSGGARLGLAHEQHDVIAPQGRGILLGIGAARGLHLEGWAIVELLRQCVQALAGVIAELSRARREDQGGQIRPRVPHEQGKRRGHRLLDQVDDHLPDDAADGELRVVERAGNRQVDVDDAPRILEQGHRQQYWQLDRIGAVDVLSKRQLVEVDLVVGLQLAVLDVVVNRHRQAALLDGVASVARRIGSQPRELDAFGHALDVGEQLRPQGLNLTRDVGRRAIIDQGRHVHIGGLRLGGGDR